MSANKVKKSSKHLKRGKKLGAVKTLKKAGAAPTGYLKVTMEPVLISNYQS